MNNTYPYLTDSLFLKEVDLLAIKERDVKIIVLDWNENPIQEIQGQITGGNINIDGSSAIRRTVNLSLIAPTTEFNVEDTSIDSLFSLNKKIKIEIGVKNFTDKYKEYLYIWFPMGLYVITQCSLSRNTSGLSISLQAKDKMCLLNGECGGALPAPVTFHELSYVDDKGEEYVEKVTIYQIIRELMNHWGNESLNNIVINDLDTKVKEVKRWNGEMPLYSYSTDLNEDYREPIAYTIDEEKAKRYSEQGSIVKKFNKGDDIGFEYVDFVYPSELRAQPGETITSVLDKIKDTLGNYEYFYNLEGQFVFQEIKNYLNNSYQPVKLKDINKQDYLIDLSKGKTVYDFNDDTLITSYSNNPQYNLINNDFVVWGKRTTASGQEIPVRYHLAIDDKPQIGTKLYTVYLEQAEKETDTDKVNIVENINKDNVPMSPDSPVGFYCLTSSVFVLVNRRKQNVYTKLHPDLPFKKQVVTKTLYEKRALSKKFAPIEDNPQLYNITTDDWRTELYLQGINSEPYGIASNYYYPELKDQWLKLYDIIGVYPKEQENPFAEPNYEKGFLNDVSINPSQCNYFLDFIDSSSEIGKLSIPTIGRRTKVVSDDKINCVFAPDIPDLVIITDDAEAKSKRMECQERGQKYSIIDDQIVLDHQLINGGTWNSAYNKVRELLYQCTSYNENISIQCLPIYYLEPNTRIKVEDPKSNIFGDYMIKTISIPLDINSTMTISATRALERI